MSDQHDDDADALDRIVTAGGEAAFSLATAPQCVVVIACDVVMGGRAVYTSNIVGGEVNLPMFLRAVADKIEQKSGPPRRDAPS